MLILSHPLKATDQSIMVYGFSNAASLPVHNTIIHQMYSAKHPVKSPSNPNLRSLVRGRRRMEWLGFDGAAAADDDFWEKLSGSNVVPWTSWHEWNLVRDSLFSSSPATALHRITAWRAKGSLPAVVDITASLIEIQHEDPFFNAGGQPSHGLLSQELMSMLYCMAIIRLVNCVIERTRKRNGKSIAEAAEEVHIPRMLIDIRHEGSHRDLPSLEILRLASVEALEWLKIYYWNPQKDAVHCEDETKDVRKEIEAKISECAYMLTMKDTPMKSPSIVDKKRPKKQISKALKNLRRLYLCFPCAVVDVLLNFMIKHYNSSSLSEVHVGVQATTSERNMLSLFDDWEPAVLKLSKKDPNFIFTFLEAVLGKIQRQYSDEYNIDHSISSLKTVKDSSQVRGLSALFAWLVGNLLNIKILMDKTSMVECKDTSVMLRPLYRIMKLLRTCLHVATPDNEQLTGSSLILARMTANGSLSEKLAKLLKHSSPGNMCFTDNVSVYTLEQQENDIRQAAAEFELVKCSNLKIQTSHAARNADFGGDSKWGVAESWNQCVIGMLPHGFGSLNNPVPIVDDQKVDKLLQWKEMLEPEPCNCKRKLIDEDASMFQNTVAKRMKETTEDPESDTQTNELDGYVHGAGGVKGHLLLDGVWRRIGEDEINAIRSSVRIMV